MGSTIAHLQETGAEIRVDLELPADLCADDVEVTIFEHTVTVRGGRESDPEGFGKQSSRSSAFCRELRLPLTADLDQLRATLRPGMLELRAPRRTVRPRRIAVHRPNQIDPAACPD